MKKIIAGGHQTIGDFFMASAPHHASSAMESLDDPDDRATGLLALRIVAAEAGINREFRTRPRLIWPLAFLLDTSEHAQ